MSKVPRVLLLLESSRSSGRSLLRGIADYAHHHGPWAFYWEPRGLEEAWPQIKSLDAQGVILRDIDKVAEVRARRLPAVVVGHSKSEVPGVINVVTDSATVARLAADHLLQCGLPNFAFCGFPDKLWSQLRGEHFRRYLAKRGHKTSFYQPPAGPSAPTWKQELRVMTRWLASLPKPVGVMACNDDRAENVIEACKIAGLHVPDQVAVIGADNDDLVCTLSDPPLSSVALNFERAGFESAKALDRLMRGRAVPNRKIIVRAIHLVARQSTDTLATQDEHVVKALRFIRTHAQENMGVIDVAKASGLSRRALEKRFRSILGHTILDEIRSSRTGQIARMLVETSLPISQIAETLNFPSPQHVARYFRKTRNMTPLEYRRHHSRK